jgi:hypothetical protein
MCHGRRIGNFLLSDFDFYSFPNLKIRSNPLTHKAFMTLLGRKDLPLPYFYRTSSLLLLEHRDFLPCIIVICGQSYFPVFVYQE